MSLTKTIAIASPQLKVNVSVFVSYSSKQDGYYNFTTPFLEILWIRWNSYFYVLHFLLDDHGIEHLWK